jgi:2-polyprenyl-3-methyl-5-hydroxy-6-metoxy-1,4-benzoquinol methylase
MSIERRKGTCVLCSSESFLKIIQDVLDFEYDTSGNWDYLQCGQCGLLNISPIPDSAKIKEAYPESYHAYHAHGSKIARIMKRRFWKSKAKRYSRFLKPETLVLELGCSFGDLLDQLNALGFQHLKGLEFNRIAVENSCKRGLDVEQGEIGEVALEGEFGMIIMENFIEHVNNPVKTFSQCNRVLHDKGFLVGETPNMQSWDYKLFKKYWGGFHAPRHLSVFNKNNLAILAEKAGFEVIYISNLLQPAHWALSVQNWAHSILDAKVLNGRSLCFPFLLILAFPVNLIQSLCSQTSSVEFVFQKIRSL